MKSAIYQNDGSIRKHGRRTTSYECFWNEAAATEDTRTGPSSQMDMLAQAELSFIPRSLNLKTRSIRYALMQVLC